MSPTAETPRGRLVDAAYDLFSHHGIQAVGVDRVIAEAGVAKATLYKQFPSKDDLAVASLRRREQVWTHDWLAGEINRNGGSPGSRLLAIFDAFGRWFRRKDYEGCFFINSLLESRDRHSPVGAASLIGLDGVRDLARDLAAEAGVEDPDGFARGWQILMSGSIVSAAQGNRGAAKDVREIAILILERNEIPYDA